MEPENIDKKAPAARLLLLIPTTSYRVADFMAAARDLEVEVTVGSNRRQVLERLSAGATAHFDFDDPAAGTAQIVDYARAYPLTAIVGVDDRTTLLAATASAALGLPHNAPESVAATGNKYRLRTALANAGLPAPGFRLVALDENPADGARETRYPCVLKPLTLAASRGVIRADTPEAFVAAFRRIAGILERSDDAPSDAAERVILVEDYIPGIEVALEGLLDDGRLHMLALFDKPDPLEGPFFEETIYVTPSRLSEAVQSEIADATRRAVAALGLREGPIHAELRLNERGVWPLEIAARSIGGLCARVLHFGAGRRLEELVLRHALGLPIASLERDPRPAGVMMIPIPSAGVLRDVDGIEAARSVPGVEDVVITIPRGREVVPVPDGDKYLGFIFARADTPAAAEAGLREAHRRLVFDIVPAT